MDGEVRPRKLQKIEDSSVIAQEERRSVAANSSEAHADDQSSAHEDDGRSSEHDNVYSSNDAPTKPGADVSGLSKNQLKKLKRRQEWEAGRDARKQKRKEKRRAKKERQLAVKAEQAQDPTETEENNAHGATTRPACTRTKSSRRRSVLLPITFLLDCDFDDLMMEKEIISLESQVTRCYSDNTKSPYRAHLVISSFNKKLKERFDTVFNKQYEQWKGVTITPEDYISAAGLAQSRMCDRGGGSLEGPLANQTEEVTPENGEIIYLTSDSPDTLTELRPYNTYVIGALVDKNRHKGICYKRAMSGNVKTARLPIGDYMQMASRSVLTTNHVVEIMLKWLQLGDWAEAFTLVMPKRKGARLKTDGKQGGEAKEAKELDKPGRPADEGEDDDLAVVASATPEVEAC